MKTEGAPRVVLIEGAPGPPLLMARAYAATVAGLLLRTPLRWIFVAMTVSVALVAPAMAYVDGAPVRVAAQLLVLGVVAMVPSFVVIVELTTIVWAAGYAVRRAIRPSVVCIATHGWSTAAVWAEQNRATGDTHIRLWASFPGHVGGVAALRFLRHADDNGLTVTAHARTDSLADLYVRSGFERTGRACPGGRPLMRRVPQGVRDLT